MLSNKVVFLAQRCPKFKKKCLCWNNFRRAGRGQGEGGDLDPPLFSQLDTFTPRDPSPGPSSIFRQLGNHTCKTDSECHRAEPCVLTFLLMTLNRGKVAVFVRVLHQTIPGASEEQSPEPIRIAVPPPPRAKWVTVAQRKAFSPPRPLWGASVCCWQGFTTAGNSDESILGPGGVAGCNSNEGNFSKGPSLRKAGKDNGGEDLGKATHFS